MRQRRNRATIARQIIDYAVERYAVETYYPLDAYRIHVRQVCAARGLSRHAANAVWVAVRNGIIDAPFTAGDAYGAACIAAGNHPTADEYADMARATYRGRS